jgi:hypothetical protein
MNSSAGVTLRLLVLTTVVLGMPLLAVPQAQRSLTHWQRPKPRSVVHRHTPNGEILAVGSGDPERAAWVGPKNGAEHSVSMRAKTGLSGNATARVGTGGWEFGGDSVVKLTLSSSLQQRLERLGAQYLVVERLEVSGLYRCVCLVDVPGTSYQRPFEAADLLPEKAVQRVLGELETWRLAMRELGQAVGD